MAAEARTLSDGSCKKEASKDGVVGLVRGRTGGNTCGPNSLGTPYVLNMTGQKGCSDAGLIRHAVFNASKAARRESKALSMNVSPPNSDKFTTRADKGDDSVV